MFGGPVLPQNIESLLPQVLCIIHQETYRKVNDSVVLHGMIQTFRSVGMKDGRGCGKEAADKGKSIAAGMMRLVLFFFVEAAHPRGHGIVVLGGAVDLLGGRHQFGAVVDCQERSCQRSCWGNGARRETSRSECLNLQAVAH